MAETLLLNASWEPLRIIPLKRAICLILAQKAEIVEEGTGQVRSASMAYPMPRVIRLLRFVRVPYRQTLPLHRRTLMARDNHTCQYCGKKATTIDHVLPRSRGGRHVWDNVAAACSPCNNRKADKTPQEANMKLAKKPYAPKGKVWILVGIAQVDPSWETYLVGLAM